ncbi:hypothetical protein [Pseudonocardia pini]|uniref:hypothetical protein n=1 Tax=Pseudonocardia pini TaxID=2758030 RepID=UPI0015F014DF|nr:hypothetical protein [Pseudonocardia pini]
MLGLPLSLLGPVVGPFANLLKKWDYRPTTSWFSDFITVNWNARDAELEQKVLGDVGSYGLQLSRVLDAVELLLADKELAALTPEQQRTVVRLQDLAQQARDSVARHRVI